MLVIEVVAAILKQDDKVLIAERNRGQFDGMFEFPGGKIEKNETQEEALIREMLEEFEIEIKVSKFLMKVEHTYSDFKLIMNCYECYIVSGEIQLHDHHSIRWITLEQNDINWVPADIKVIEELRRQNENIISNNE